MTDISQDDGDASASAKGVGHLTFDESRLTSKTRIEMRVYPEARATGFSHRDQEISFYTQVAALLRPSDIVLDFGAGRGEWYHDDAVHYRRYIQNFRGRCAHVDGCDVDPVVLTNDTLDAARTFEAGASLPYEDGRFDIVIARYVFEHLQDPAHAASELLRVTRDGGWICAVTPNKYGYVALASRLVPNRLHAKLLRLIQPHRKERDVFPTAYLLNTPRAIRHHFGERSDIFSYRESAVPSYHFGSIVIFQLLRLLHWLLPSRLGTGFFIFIRKRPRPAHGESPSPRASSH